MITFSNPRLRAEFDDWPSGAHRVKCVFEVHHDKRGWRVSRMTAAPDGAWYKPKYTTYSGQAAIVDGSDGRTYILEHAAVYGFIKIRASDFKDAHEIGRPANGGSCVFHQDEPELFKQLMQIILAGGSIGQPVA